MIFTGYFAHYRGSNGVSIANSKPPVDDCPTYKPLKPDWSLVKAYKSDSISWKEFRRAYIEQLKRLDVHKVYRQLNGKVLLCWEKPDKHCHREIVREWFNRNGYACEELEATKEMYTCSCCKFLNNHHSSSLCCELTGEIFTNSQQLSRTCEDWGCRF